MRSIKYIFMPMRKKVAPKKNAIKFLASVIKPIITMLVFLLASGWSPHLLERAETPAPCASSVSTVSAVLAGSVASVADFENKEIMVGKRVLRITRHAAERMVERSVTVAHIQKAVEAGKLFAYSHSGRIKIGYFDEAGRLFLSVDQRHEKIITAIRKSSKQYMERLVASAIHT